MEVILTSPPNSSTVAVYSGYASSFTAANLGSGFGVYKQLSGNAFQFKSLIATSPIELTNNTNDITIAIDEVELASLIASSVSLSLPTANRAVITDGTGDLAVSSITSTKLGYLTDVTSNIQAQIDTKQATITGAASTVTSSDLTISRVLTSNASGKIAVSSITTSLLDYLSGLSSNVQTQLDAKIGTTTSSPIQMTGGFRSETSGSYFKIKEVSIGDWNMDTTDTVGVAHGLGDRTKILAVFATIIPDLGTTIYNLANTTAAGVVDGAVTAWDNTNVYLYRVTSGGFDSSSFNNTPLNRGFVTIIYKV